MKTLTKTLLTAASLMLGITVVNAATTWNNAGSDTQIFNADNWSNGLPSSTNVGAFAGANGNATWTTTQGLTDYYVNVTAGTISSSGFNARTISGGEWNLDGGSFSHVSSNGQSLGLGGGVQYNIINSASSLTVANGLSVSGSGSELVLNVGEVTVSGTANLNLVSAGTFEVNGGTASIGGNINMSTNFNAGNLVLNGGTLTATNLNYGTNATGKITLGGSTAGTATFANFAGTEASRRIDWLTGSLISLTISDAAGWAETEWNASRMFFNGSSGTTLGLSWADATNSAVGLGGGSYFDFDSATNTLALAVIPEPSTLVLFGIAGLAAMGFLRRRK
jgi:hypothetical protein